MRAASDLVAAELQADYVQLFELLPSGNAVRLMGSTGPCRAAIGSVERLDPETLLADAGLRAGRPVIISDWQDESRLVLTAALRDAGISSSVGIVIGVGRSERVFGFLCVHSREPRRFPDHDLLFLETVGNLLANAIASARTAMSLDTLLENAPDVIVWFDSDLRMTNVNVAIERTTGTPPESLIGKTSSELGVPESLVPTWELVLRQVLRSGRGQAFVLTLRTAMGERVFESRIVPELGPDGSVQSLITISRDVTEQRRAEAERMAVYQQLVAQQNIVQELMGRLAEDRERLRERNTVALQFDSVTDREHRILSLVAAGWSNREIGAELGFTTGTVKNHVARILSKLNVTDRTQAAVRAVELGLVEGARTVS